MIESDFFRLLSLVKKNGLCLEIGTFKGNGSRTILEHCNPSLLISVDPYLEYTKDRNFSVNPIGYGLQKDHINRYLELQLEMMFESRFRLIRALSDELLPRLPKEMFSLIYIDGAHTFDQVYKDLLNSVDLISSHGFIICDDFLSGPPKPDFGVNDAVKKVVDSKALVPVAISNDARFKKIMLVKNVDYFQEVSKERMPPWYGPQSSAQTIG